VRASAFYGPLILLFWQAAPIAVHPDSSGRLRLSVGYGSGGYDSDAEQVSCTGQTLQRSHLGGQWGGPTGELEAWPASNLRVRAFASSLSGTLQDSHAGSAGYQRRVTGALVASEGEDFGIGAGAADVAGTGRSTVGMVYLRAGPLDRLHYRIEIVPAEIPSEPYLLRAGIGVNQGLGGGARYALGFVTAPSSGAEHSHIGAFGEAIVPAGGNLEIRLAGRVGIGELYHQSISTSGTYKTWGLSAGLRYSLLH
jgi:hypothetical protein